MKLGVRTRTNFICFLTNGSLQRGFVRLEVYEAIKWSKNIILVQVPTTLAQNIVLCSPCVSAGVKC